ncbi:MAG TPA: ABC transporter substrate-binding protein [Candidatus Magasanikbacteria bacterium]|nr:ABC transporter substrate-binding protein [Candidatus Magasanikbacteria bacterium]
MPFFKDSKAVRGGVGKKKPRPVHDIALLSRLRSRRFPAPRQLFQISHVLSIRERIVFFAAVLVFVCSLGLIGVVVANEYRITVPKVSGTYREGVIGSPQSLNPLFSSLNEVDEDIVSLVYSGLLRYDGNRRLVPDLAVKYDVSADSKTYTFELKQNVRWHDGEPFTADDVVHTFELIQDPEVGSPLRVTFQKVTVAAVGEYSVSFTLEEAFPSFLTSLTVGILPKHVWSGIPASQVRLAQRNLQPIGTGRFEFKRLVKNSDGFVESIELERYPDFYRNPAYLKEFIFQFFSDYDGPQGVITALREQKIDGISFVPYEYREKVMRKHIVLNTLELPQYTALFFNQKNEILKDKQVRAALSLAIDKDRIVADVLDREARIMSGPLLPGFPGFTESATTTKFSVEEANAALDKVYDRISAADYRAALLEARVAERIAKQKLENNVEISTTTPSTPPENSLTMVTSTFSNEEIIRDMVSQELDRELNPAQLFYRHKKGGDKKTVIGFELVTAATPEYSKIADIIAGYFQEIGVRMTTRLVDPQDITREVLRSRSYDMLLYGIIIGSDPDQYPFWHSSQIGYPGLNLSQYSNKSLDQILEKARVSTNPGELTQLYTNFSNTLVADVPAVFLYTPTYTYALTDEVKGFAVERIAKPADRFANILDWYLAEKKVWGTKNAEPAS